MKPLTLSLITMTLAMTSSLLPAQVEEPLSESRVPKDSHTTLGLYVDPARAHRMWKADPEHVRIIDVRTPEEYVFIGHAPMAINVPLSFMEHRIDDGKPVMRPNPDFVTQITARLRKDDVVIFMCRSGPRSAKATNLLAATGRKQVYNLFEGFEGDLVQDKDRTDFGRRTLNGWKNAALPWTYDLDPDLVYQPAPQQKPADR